MFGGDLESLRRDVEKDNQTIGTLQGYNCPKCLNRGYTFEVDEENMREVAVPCSCLNIRKSIKLANESGLGNLFETKKFRTFVVKEDWQKELYEKAYKYATERKGSFFVGGNSGSGKTHICTAIVRQFIMKAVASKYMLWRDESTTLKAIVNDAAYDDAIKIYKEIECLYIDDFLWGKPTEGDLNLAFEIINARYNRNLPTIISSEKTIDEITKMRESLGSRIFEMVGEYNVVTGKDKKRNYRFWRNK